MAGDKSVYGNLFILKNKTTLKGAAPPPPPTGVITRAELARKQGKSETVGAANAPAESGGSSRNCPPRPGGLQGAACPTAERSRRGSGEGGDLAGHSTPRGRPPRRLHRHRLSQPGGQGRQSRPPGTRLRTAAGGQSEPSSAAMSSARWLLIGWLY